LALEKINSPEDLRALSYPELSNLAQEIRTFLIEKVSASGGHLGPNLGVVEVTIAMHRVFASPKDVFIFDTGHQSYVHKILTGRAAGFDQLRRAGGLSGYPSRRESEHDVVENSHASGSLSWAEGVAKAFLLQGERDRRVVALVGDGALTGGMTWEAVNNIAANDQLPLVIIVNDNERSYSPTIGGITTHLSALRTNRDYERFLDWGKGVLERTPVVGAPIYETLHGIKKGLKDIVAPQGMFEDLGLKYYGPVDGHNIQALEHALTNAKNFGGPILVHVITEKGRGHAPAIEDEAEKFHAVGIVDPKSGAPLAQPALSWTNVFSQALVKVADANPKVVAITAAMLGPTGLSQMAEKYPDRVFDVGIAESHAVASAAGMAFAGLHPIVAVYSTFLNRAFDQLLLDVGLHQAGVTFVLDRAGVTGDDGASHNGIWDLALAQIVPGIYINAPRDGATLQLALTQATGIENAPSLIRFPKGAVGEDIPAIGSCGPIDILQEGSDVLLVSVGAMAKIAIAAGRQAMAEGVQTRIIDLKWIKPLPKELLELAKNFQQVLVVEDGIKHGSVASAIETYFKEAKLATQVTSMAIAPAYLDHGKRDQILAEQGISISSIASQLHALGVASRL
jgi:1-deoxy-D-xylulose-5-phosphate synthase